MKEFKLNLQQTANSSNSIKFDRLQNDTFNNDTSSARRRSIENNRDEQIPSSVDIIDYENELKEKELLIKDLRDGYDDISLRAKIVIFQKNLLNYNFLKVIYNYFFQF